MNAAFFIFSYMPKEIGIIILGLNNKNEIISTIPGNSLKPPATQE
jgi:hypothetical protein